MIDKEVRRIMDECYQEAKLIIESHIDVLHRCAAALLEKERINRAEFEALFEVSPTRNLSGWTGYNRIESVIDCEKCSDRNYGIVQDAQKDDKKRILQT